MRPWPGTQVTLVSDVSHAPYSGMLPGHLTGIYSWEETHIDLRRLCAWAGARFIHAAAAGLDLPRKQIQLQDRPPLGFPGYWLYSGGVATVHLLGERKPREGIVVRGTEKKFEDTGRFDVQLQGSTVMARLKE
mgnify:CR=1 FL=1